MLKVTILTSVRTSSGSDVGVHQFRTVAEAKTASAKFPMHADMWHIERQSDLKQVPGDVLVRAFNMLHNGRGVEVHRFPNRAAAETRVFAALSGHLEDPPVTPPVSSRAMSDEQNTSTMTAEEAETLRNELAVIEKDLADAKEKFTAFTANRRERAKALRAQLKAANKATKTRAKRPAGSVSDVGKIVLDLIAREEGASKQELFEALPDSKPAYISALLGRVLGERGYKIEARSVEGQRGKRYFLIGRPAAVEA